jgi:hypothetical protein
MGTIAGAARGLWVACPEGRLVVVPRDSGGERTLPLTHNVGTNGEETQIGVGTDGEVYLVLRDEVKPAVYTREITTTSRGFWIGTLGEPAGLQLATGPGRYLISIWFDEDQIPGVMFLQLGLKRLDPNGGTQGVQLRSAAVQGWSDGTGPSVVGGEPVADTARARWTSPAPTTPISNSFARHGHRPPGQ